MNPDSATRREYRGLNIFILLAANNNTGYQVGCWSSFKQWQQIGAQLHRAEKETPVVL